MGDFVDRWTSAEEKLKILNSINNYDILIELVSYFYGT